MRYPAFIADDITFPPFVKVRVHHSREHLTNIAGALTRRLERALPLSGIYPGQKVAIGVGSRGIANLPLIVRTIVQQLRHWGAQPVILPAMGSHGGATTQGQRQVLQTLGIDEKSCEAPIRSSLEVDQIGMVLGEVPVYFARDAIEQDHTICINRIKPHTKFKGPLESGLTKMLCVGLGKHKGAVAYHQWALKYGFYPLLQAMGKVCATAANFRFGVAVVENAWKQTLAIEAIPAAELARREKMLLKLAQTHLARLPFDCLDALIIEQIGKDISGAGMDPNVSGRAYDWGEDDFTGILSATRMAVLGLSASSAGNGLGLGNADFITERVWQALDYEKTLINALTSLSLRKAFIPIRMPSDRKAIQACFRTLGPVAPEKVRAVIIRDTSHVTSFWASQALAPDIKADARCEALASSPLMFDSAGTLRMPP